MLMEIIPSALSFENSPKNVFIVVPPTVFLKELLMYIKQ